MDEPGSKPLGALIDIGGRRMHCVRAGSGSPTVVFESGGGGGSSIQDLPILRLICSFARGVVYDRAGLGWSDPAPPGRSLEERAGDLHALLDAAGERPPYILVGLSFGGLLVRTFCGLYQDETAGMVLVDACDEEKYFPTMARMRGMHEAELKAAARRAASGELRQALEADLQRSTWFTDEEKAALLEMVPRAGFWAAALDELNVLDRTPEAMWASGSLGALGDRPLVVLSHGRPYIGEMAPWEDGWMESQRRLAALSTRNALLVAQGCGHSIGLERPKLVAAAIAAVVKAAAGGGNLEVAEVERLAEYGPRSRGE